MTWNPHTRKGDNTSFTELSTLAQCEQRWWYRFPAGGDSEPSMQMLKGTIIHEGAAAFWSCPDSDVVYKAMVAAGLHDLEPQDRSDTEWLMWRYCDFYAPMVDRVRVIEHEMELKAKLPGTNITVWGHLDGVYEIDGKLFVVERKTYGRRDRLDLLDIDPQITLYDWLAKANGISVYGILFDGIYTRRWALEKPTQKALIEANAEDPAGVRFTTKQLERSWAKSQVEAHPGVDRALSESFDQVWLYRTKTQVAQAQRWASDILSRRAALRRSKRPVRNIGPLCKGCFEREQCGEELAFTPIEIVTDQTGSAA